MITTRLSSRYAAFAAAAFHALSSRRERSAPSTASAGGDLEIVPAVSRGRAPLLPLQGCGFGPLALPIGAGFGWPRFQVRVAR